jgi:4-hydroxy 2-oxovalerate aldolase
MKNVIKILDCTLRDGGYYNNWDFPQEVVDSYLKSIALAKIDYIELGLRNFPKEGFLGAFAYTTEGYLDTLELPEGPTYGVMVDAKTILTSELSIKDSIDALFVPANESKIGLVRVAAHFSEVEKSADIVKYLKKLGYKVGYNLMQAGGKACDVISSKALIAKEWDALDVLYFADSLGNMDATEVERIVNALRVHWSGELGIHTHNNMSKGLDNTLKARGAGVTWLDSTVTGMGRGAGNTQTECLLAVLDQEGSNYFSQPVYELVIRHFETMQKEFGWGSNLLYFLGAQNEIHPTYIQNLLSNTHFGTDEIVGAIDYLSKLDGTTSYNGDILKTALSFNSSAKPLSGSAALFQKFENRELLIVSNGPSLQRYLTSIKNYIDKRKPIVIAVNAIEELSAQYIDYYAISHNSKFLSEHNIYRNLKKPIVLPAHRFSEQELQTVKGNYLDYGISITEGAFNASLEYCVIPYDLTVPYALAIAINGGADTISLIGFDGFERGDIRQTEMVELFSNIKTKLPDLNLVALTPTTYPIKQGSIYAPNL